ncbi:YceI family protein [Novosphingobium sp.]|uniref:YceI family protein n=1 Tax=Novosphingobium sp. TaxID=1874826 RepID=UPI003BACE18C
MRRLFRPAVLLTLTLMLAGPAAQIGAEAPANLPGTLDAARVTAGTYSSDPGHSYVAWRVNHLGFNESQGLIGDVTGTLTLDPANLAAAKVSAVIPVAKLVTPNPALTASLLAPGADGGKPHFFGAAPADATFVSTSVVPGADGLSAEVNGNLTLNGVTRPVTLKAHLSGAGINPFNAGARTVGFMAETTIKRSDYGIMFLLPIVGDEVHLTISAAFEKK